MISYKNISLGFEGRQIFDGFCFDVQKGQKAALKGRSGCGKTTLLNMAMGFMKPDSGTVIIDGKDVDSRNIRAIRKKMCWLPQNTNVLGTGNVKSLLLQQFSYSANKQSSPEIRELEEHFELLNLDKNILNQTMDKISGGEKQRIGIIICKLLKKSFILLDEPTSALDKESLNKVAEYIMKDYALTVLSASHDDEWLKHCDKIVEL